VEQYKAYNLLVENNGRIICRKNVTFPIKKRFEVQPDKEAYDEEDTIDDPD
jgi:hypothetical protein